MAKCLLSLDPVCADDITEITPTISTCSEQNDCFDNTGAKDD